MKRTLKYILIINFFILVMGSNRAAAQNLDTLKQIVDNLGRYLLYRNHDSTYISNYSEEVALRLVLANKFNFFRAKDRINGTSMRYRPFENLNFGAGVAYKWFAMDITFSIGLRDLSEFENYKSLDFQSRIYSSKHYISATIQYYRGYQLIRTKGFAAPITDAVKFREDMRIINFGLQYLYALNYTRFSLKAPFVFNEVQRKSAGSFIAGASFSLFNMVADSSLVPQDFAPYFSPQLYIKDISVLSVAMSFGYMFTFVVKEHFFLTLSAIPGINLNSGDYFSQDRSFIAPNINLKFNTMNALGYNGRRFFAGVNFIADSYLSRIDNKLHVEIGYGKSTFFVGYRFHSEKKHRKKG